MGLAYDPPVIYTTGNNPTSPSDLVTFLDTQVTAAGWGSRTAITGGFKYTLTSPQGLQVKCKIKTFDSDFASVQFLSTDEVREGYVHKLKANGTDYKPYQAHVSPSQLFVSVYNRNQGQSSVQGGIPWCPNVEQISDCEVAAGPGLATEAWWSNGDTDGTDIMSFRIGHRSNNNWSACYNGVLVGLFNDRMSRLQINTLNFATNIDYTFGVVQRTRFFNNTALRVDPLISWPETDGGLSKVRGQLWNSIINTLSLDLEEELTIIDDETGFAYPFITYMSGADSGGGSRYGSLILLKGEAALSESGAYWYFR